MLDDGKQVDDSWLPGLSEDAETRSECLIQRLLVE